MNTPELQAKFKDMGVRTFHIGECIGGSKRETVMFEGQENVLYRISTSPKTKPIVEASSHIYEETKITRWINNCPNC